MIYFLLIATFCVWFCYAEIRHNLRIERDDYVHGRIYRFFLDAIKNPDNYQELSFGQIDCFGFAFSRFETVLESFYRDFWDSVPKKRIFLRWLFLVLGTLLTVSCAVYGCFLLTR